VNSWRHCLRCGVPLLALLALGGCGRIVLTADDLVYMPGRATLLVAQVEEDSPFVVRDGVEDQEVVYVLDGVVVGRARTDGEGRAELVTRVDQPAAGADYGVTIKRARRTWRVDRPIHRWDATRVIVVVDVDHTLSQTDYSTLLTEPVDTESEPYEGAREVLTALDEAYELLYLTARPRFLLDKTREWLTRHGFPAAPLVTTRTVSDVLAQAERKRELLEQRKELWPNVLIGIGDKASDIEAYAATGMLSVIRAPADVSPDVPNVVLMADWTAIGRFFERQAETLADAEKLRGVIEREAGTALVMPSEEGAE
jgi:hypothetical protein